MTLELMGVHCSLGSFELEVSTTIKSSIVSLFGASGAGKTTLIEIIAGLRRPSSGKVILNGRTLCDSTPPASVPPQDRAIGYVPQDLCLFPHLTVEQNILFSDRFAKSGAPKNDQEGLLHLLETLEIEGLLARMPSDISGGEKQRVALARALRMQPELLLLDEPLASLDQPLRRRLIPYLQKIQKEYGTPMIYVTHDADEAAELSDEILVMQSGKIAAQGPPSSIFTKIQQTRHILPGL